MNNNKGFNWFFPIAIGAILLFFFSNMNSDSTSNQIDEEAFYKLMEQGKVDNVLIYKDTEKADVFLNPSCKNRVGSQTKNNRKEAHFLHL
jgi:cell division protease FtsH